MGVPLDYLREIAEVSGAAVLKVTLLRPFAAYRRRVPKAAYHVAKLTVARLADEGEGAQAAVSEATKDGVPRSYIRAVLEEKHSELPPALREVCEFARSVARNWENLEVREALRSRYGSEGLCELAFAIASAQVYPTLKRIPRTQACTTQFIGAAEGSFQGQRL